MAQLALMLALATPALADPALNPEVTQATINETICAPGYTYTVRPSWYDSAKLKQQLLKDARRDLAQRTQVPTGITSSRSASAGPRPIRQTCSFQPWEEAYRKDRVEIQARRCVCAGKATLAEAQHDLATDWQAAYHKYAKMVCREAVVKRVMGQARNLTVSRCVKRGINLYRGCRWNNTAVANCARLLLEKSSGASRAPDKALELSAGALAEGDRSSGR